jgi:hypothetical protein
MEAYIDFVKQWVFEEHRLSVFLTVCWISVFWFALAFFLPSKINLVARILLACAAAFALFVLTTFGRPAMSFYFPKPYDAYASFGIGVFSLIIIGVLEYRDRQRTKRSSYFAWSISSWESDERGNWKKQPILIIDGEKYIFETPHGYIHLFQQMKERGYEHPNIDINLIDLNNTVRWRNTCRAYLNLPPDPPFTPTVNLPAPNFRISEPVPSTQQSSSVYSQPVPTAQAQSSQLVPQESSSKGRIPAATSQPFSNSGPATGMALRLKRGERVGTLGKIVFTLDARIDVSAENRALIEKYKLGDRVIYESANREKYRDKALRNVANTQDQPGLFASPGSQVWGLAKTLGRVGAAAINASFSALSLRVTVNSLMSGVHIECKDMNELLDAEESIRQAGQNLKNEIATATSFSGQEDVIDL